LNVVYQCENEFVLSGLVGDRLDLTCSTGKIKTQQSYVSCNGADYDHSEQLAKVSDVCDHEDRCIIGYNGGGKTCGDGCTNVRVSDPCPGKQKELNVVYQCENEFVLSGLQGDSLYLFCAYGTIKTQQSYVSCNGADYDHSEQLAKVSDVCDHEDRCIIGYNGGGRDCGDDCTNVRVSDPCPGKLKELNVFYTCEIESTFRLSGLVGDSLHLSCPAGEIKTEKSFVSCDGAYYDFESQLARVSDVCDHEDRCIIGYNGGGKTCGDGCTNVRVSDPCPGKMKELNVFYACEIGSTFRLSGLVGDSLHLSCPAGEIHTEESFVRCDGAYYDFESQLARVSDVCDHEDRCIIGYNGGGKTCGDGCTNVRVSDPCPGKMKELNVFYTCTRPSRRSFLKSVDKTADLSPI